MKRLIPLAIPALLLVLAVAGPADAQRPPRGMMRPLANPSALIAADIAFSRLAQDKGKAKAFAETATKEAEMFGPQRVPVAEWLKRNDDGAALKWQPHGAWISCDGSAGVTRGAWQSNTASGWYTTIWQQQKKGDYKWALDQGSATAKPVEAPDFLEGRIADCPARSAPPGAGAIPGGEGPPRGKRPPPGDGKDVPLPPLAGPIPALSAAAGADAKDGRSRDGTLAWRSVVLPDGARDFTVWLWKDGAMTPVIQTHADAAKAAG
ncbi:hypothetical protein [Novosphingobium olei]|uniref:DUF4440 domain-containing protein n=1 Tax=Novosphingobium olei TaxID=2728851 RepID=A0A7Y0BRP2_9SPHN|nr:hypothetical protein [Novosphingobium olei]NML95340.1 hypothetical protein [Novosphingobium olei]